MDDPKLATVSLSDEGEELEATFVPGAGMLCCSLRHGGEELLAQNDGVDAYARRGKTMGIPLLYPWANRLAAFDYSVAGKTVRVPHDPTRIAVDDNGLPIHGVIGGRLGWGLKDTPLGPNTGQSLAARLSWSESEPLLFEVFPFRHDLLYEARFADGRLEIEVTVHACGEDVVPVAFGFHPYLAPGGPREQWQIELPPMRHLRLDPNQIPIDPDPTGAPGHGSPPSASSWASKSSTTASTPWPSPPASPSRPGSGGSSSSSCTATRARRSRAAVRALHLLRADDRPRQCAAQR